MSLLFAADARRGEDMLRAAVTHRRGGSMATLAFQFEEIAARELKPELYELYGITREAVEAHYKLYAGYVNKRNEILGELASVDLSHANQIYADLRAMNVETSVATRTAQGH